MTQPEDETHPEPKDIDEVGRTRAFLTGILERMGLPLGVDIQQDGRVTRVRLTGAVAAELVGGHGAAARSSVLEALQIVTGRAVDAGENRSLVIDAADFRDQRIALLDAAANRLARLATERQLAVRVYGMNSFDRRGVHVALAEREDVRTDSEGEGVFRTLIVLGGAPQAAEG